MRSIPLLVLALAACRPSHPGVQLTLNGTPLGSCDNVTVDELHDGSQPGGFKLSCAKPRWSAYFEYDTRTRKDGTINSFSFDLDPAAKPEADGPLHPLLTPENNFRLQMKPAIDASLPDAKPCASAKALNRTSGEAPVPRSMTGSLLAGSYSFELSEPCGQLILTVKE